MKRAPRSVPAPTLVAVAAALAAGALVGCDASPAGPESDPRVEGAAATITAADVAEVVGIIAHDSMGGRDTPGPGLEKTAAYIADRFAALGLEPAGTAGYLQRFDFTYPVRDPATVVLELADGSGPALEHGSDYLFLAAEPARGDVRGPLVWGGDAATHAVASLPLAGGVVLYDLPVSDYDLPAIHRTVEASDAVRDGGGVAVGYVVGPDFTREAMARAVARTERTARWIPEFWIREAAADSLLAAAGHDLATLRAGEPRSLGDTIRARGLLEPVTATPPNVVGIVRGSDPARSDEYVAVTAHFDHLGIGLPDANGDSIANGADDNASGTAAVLEMAEAMAGLETPPARSILFLLVSGEEYGLLGSSHFARHPTVPLSDIVANINLDMVGRNAPVDVIGIGKTYTELGAMADSLASLHDALRLTVIPDPVPDERLFFRSDQLVFACRDVPALFLHTGPHGDYHTVDDELEQLDTDKVARVAGLAFYLAHAVAERDARPAWTVQGEAALRQLSYCP